MQEESIANSVYLSNCEQGKHCKSCPYKGQKEPDTYHPKIHHLEAAAFQNKLVNAILPIAKT